MRVVSWLLRVIGIVVMIPVVCFFAGRVYQAMHRQHRIGKCVDVEYELGGTHV